MSTLLPFRPRSVKLGSLSVADVMPDSRGSPLKGRSLTQVALIVSCVSGLSQQKGSGRRELALVPGELWHRASQGGGSDGAEPWPCLFRELVWEPRARTCPRSPCSRCNAQSSLTSPRSWVSGAASFTVYCVMFVWPWAVGLNTKVAESGDVKTSVADVSGGEK